MIIIRKKSIVRLASIILGALLLIVGLYFRGHSVETKIKKDEMKLLTSMYTSVCTSLENICTSFDKDIALNDKTTIAREIYSSCQTAKNSLYFCSTDMPNTVAWFNELANYSTTDMSDTALNEYYSQTAHEARNQFVSLCTNVEDITRKDSLENLLNKKDTGYYQKKLEDLSKNYHYLDNFLEIDRSEISDHAKKILNFPITPQKTKGNFCDPPLHLFATKNSYAEIFSAGGFLKRMSVEETSTIHYPLDSSFDELAVNYLIKYAPYAKNSKALYCYKNNELIYYIFCPIIKQKNISFTDCTESIKLAISVSDGKLMAFDASNFIKTHSQKEYPQCPELKYNQKNISTEDAHLLSDEIIYTENGFFLCRKLSTKNNSVSYLLCNESGNTEYYNEKDFLFNTGII